MNMARTGRTAPFIVMETEILSRGMSLKRICKEVGNINIHKLALAARCVGEGGLHHLNTQIF